MFNITGHKGFSIEFPNGIIASVQWGPGNYCDHHGSLDLNEPMNTYSWKSSTAEVAAINASTGRFVAVNGFTGPAHGDDVAGRLTPAQVLEFLNAVAAITV